MSVEASSGPASVPGQKNKKNKDYSSTTRIYDSDGYRLRSDALCFKDERKQEVHSILQLYWRFVNVHVVLVSYLLRNFICSCDSMSAFQSKIITHFGGLATVDAINIQLIIIVQKNFCTQCNAVAVKIHSSP